MQSEILKLLATPKVLQVGSHGYNLNSSLSLSLFVSFLFHRKEILPWEHRNIYNFSMSLRVFQKHQENALV
jgi:hypothetical protein